MSRMVPMDKPLSDDDRAYLLSRSMDGTVRMLDDRFKTEPQPTETQASLEEDEDPGYENWTNPELESELRDRNLPVTGTKAERVSRLRADDKRS